MTHPYPRSWSEHFRAGITEERKVVRFKRKMRQEHLARGEARARLEEAQAQFAALHPPVIFPNPPGKARKPIALRMFDGAKGGSIFLVCTTTAVIFLILLLSGCAPSERNVTDDRLRNSDTVRICADGTYIVRERQTGDLLALRTGGLTNIRSTIAKGLTPAEVCER